MEKLKRTGEHLPLPATYITESPRQSPGPYFGTVFSYEQFKTKQISKTHQLIFLDSFIHNHCFVLGRDVMNYFPILGKITIYC